MYPILFKLGPLTLYTYGLFFALAWLATTQIILRQIKKLGFSPTVGYDYIALLLPTIVIGSRLLYVILNLSDYLPDFTRIFYLWEGGLFFHGGLIAGIIFTVIFTRYKKIGLAVFADVIGLVLPLGHAIGRIGCFFAGCCYGRPTDLPWGLIFTHPHTLAPVNVKLHPTQLYEVAGNLIIFFTLLILYKNKKFNGQIILSSAILISLLRLSVESFRADYRGPVFFGLTLTQFIAGIIFVSSGIIYFKMYRYKN